MNPKDSPSGPAEARFMFMLAIEHEAVPAVFDYLKGMPAALADRILVAACGLDEPAPGPRGPVTDAGLFDTQAEPEADA